MEMQIYKDEETKEEDDLFQLMKIQMSTEQEQIFMTSHYLYLQYGSDNTKFVVNFDEVWKNVDFSRRDAAKRILIKHFVEHIDYMIGAPQLGGASLEEKAAPQLGGAAFINETNGNLAYHLGGAAFTTKKNLGGSGQNKELILLTVDCFKNFCMLAATPKAKEIRTYYIKMENIMHEYYKNFKSKNNELQTTLQLSQNSFQLSQTSLQLSQSSLQLSQSALQQSIKETAIKRHEVLIESNLNKWVVYFCRIQLREDGSIILKIGETIDIKNRMDALKCNFETNIILLDVFRCENSIKFEKSLHNSNELTKYKYNQLEHKNKKLSTEAYHIPNQKEYEKIVKFANTEMHKYNNIELTKLRIEEKKMDLVASFIPFCKSYDELMNILNKITSPIHFEIELKEKIIKEIENTETIEVVEVDENEEIECKEEHECISNCKEENIMVPNSSTGPIVQIYHKSDLTKVVHVYNSIIEATRDFNYNNKVASFTSIKKAYQYKTIYQDHRWHFISNRQELNLQQPRNIGETMVTQERNQGQIAMLNIDKTKIIKVFKLSKDAAKEILQHPSAMCTAIKHSSPLNNHYWIHWENVDVLLQDEFLKINLPPTKQPNIRGIQIKQIHPITNEIVKLFVSYTDIQKELKISVKKIKELIESNEIYKGKYKFKLV